MLKQASGEGNDRFRRERIVKSLYASPKGHKRINSMGVLTASCRGKVYPAIDPVPHSNTHLLPKNDYPPKIADLLIRLSISFSLFFLFFQHDPSVVTMIIINSFTFTGSWWDSDNWPSYVYHNPPKQ